MDATSLHLPEILVAIAIAVFLHLRWFGKRQRRQPSHKFLPEIPGALPLLGHLHLLGGKQPLARKLASFSDKYGPVFTIRLGANNLTAVVSDYDAVKECFTANDRALAFRPDSTQAQILGYNYALFGFASYGDYFRYIKKILISEVLSANRIKALRRVQISEIDSLIHDLYQQSKAGGGGKTVISVSEGIHSCVINIMTRIIAGKRYFDKSNYEEQHSVSNFSGGRPISEMIREFMLVMGTPVPSDLIPILRWVLPRGAEKAMKRLFKELDVVMQSWIDEHKEKQVVNDGDESNRDLIDVMLSEIKDEVAFGHKRETIVKAIAHQALIFGGSDTTAITLTWSLSNLLNYKRALHLAQEELDNTVGRDRWVDDSDIDNLPYLKAVIKETLRMYPPGALSLPRIASEDITIKGYHVPKGTQFFANFWKLHRDPNVWSDPNEYKPERFLTSNADIEIFGHQFEYLPFGSGRRGCPGINFGMQATQLTLARLLQGFHWSTPGDKPVDMTEDLGIILSKTNPLQVVLTPRLPAQFYNA
ncbi:unnamed protein product [Linum tenue]|uniref:Cytochrome P450 n=1 Tax=Linum tenue TaxID=586396 RepID=A0AAV0JPR6_9ROSI|nr:unnamed protein product [Linum tenue]